LNAPVLPFRIGATSYVYPGDLVQNADQLAGQVRDIELILFETDTGETNFPDAEVVRALRDTAQAYDLTYTVHLPHDLRHDPVREHPSLALAKRVIDLTAPLTPFAYVFHLEASGVESGGWAEQGTRAIESLLACVPDARTLALENLESYAPESLEPVFAMLPIARTLDIGHMWKMGRDPLPLLERWRLDVRVVHLHGCVDQNGVRRDHLALDGMDTAQLDPVIAALRHWRGVLTLEVFEGDYYASRAAFDAAWMRVSP
jgi:sugar phosphate isomerase/epimerase